MRAVALAIAVVLMAACVKPASHASPLVPGSAGRPVYVGPMYVPFSIDQEAAVPERSGAAGKALECRYPHFSGVAYLQVGPTTRARFYVRDAGGILTKYLLVPYEGAATLPADATDSGWHRDGLELWLVPRGESVYLVSQANPSDVERWPLESPNYACG